MPFYDVQVPKIIQGNYSEYWERQAWANSVDPVWSGSTQFALNQQF